METGGGDKGKQTPMGFAGIASFVSQVDTTPAAPNADSRANSGCGRVAWLVTINLFFLIGIVPIMYFVGNNQTTVDSSTPTQNTTPSDVPPPTPVPSAPIPQLAPQIQQTTAAPLSQGESTTAVGNDEVSLMSGGGNTTYLVPMRYVTELNADKIAVDVAQREASDLDAQVNQQKALLDYQQQRVAQAKSAQDALGNEIELQRSSLDLSDESEIDAFNAKVQEYNANRVVVQGAIDRFNAQVDAYNGLVQRAQAQQQYANSLVDSYNAKLQRYGTRQ